MPAARDVDIDYSLAQRTNERKEKGDRIEICRARSLNLLLRPPTSERKGEKKREKREFEQKRDKKRGAVYIEFDREILLNCVCVCFTIISQVEREKLAG